ncbi:MAG: hypothetical protein GY856_30205 [bacterium]|nr:hypothetical protein [bacterium]
MNLRAAILAGDLDKVRELIADGTDVKTVFDDDGLTPIQLAARAKHIHIVRALAEAGADPRDLAALEFAERLLLLIQSTQEDDLEDDDLMSTGELAEWVLEAIGSELDEAVDLEIAEYESPLFRAIRAGDVPAVKKRIAAGDALDEVREIEEDTALIRAVELGHEQIVRELLAAGANVNLDGGWGTPLGFALPDLRFAQLLIDAGADVDQRGDDGHTPVAVAVEQRNLQLLRLLLEAGAHPPAAETGDESLLLEADLENAWEIYQELLPHYPEEEVLEIQEFLEEVEESEPERTSAEDAPPPRATAEDEAQERLRALVREAGFGDVARVRELIAAGAPIDGLDPYGRTALAAAAEAGQQEVLRELIAAGAEVNLVNGVEAGPRSTALICAAISPSAERDRILRILIEAGAVLDQPDPDGRTALLHAVERDVGFFGRAGGFALSTRILIAAGADLERWDRYGHTAWMKAMSLASIGIPEMAESYHAIAGMLERAGASTDGARDVELVRAAEDGESEPLRGLLEQGASPDARRHDGTPALILAVRSGDADVVDLLIGAGCDLDAREWLDRGSTTLIAAVHSGDYALVRKLVEAGADQTLRRVPDHVNTSPRALAVSYGYHRVARLLGEPKRPYKRPFPNLLFPVG